MPYIPQSIREDLKTRQPLHPGELNYAITVLVDQYLQAVGIRYESLNAVVGVLENVKHEIQRRILAGYEDMKCAENGDVFTVAIK